MLPYHAPVGTPFTSPAHAAARVSQKASGHEETRKDETSYRPRQTPPVLLHTGRPTLSLNAPLALAGDQVRQFEITIQASQDEATG
ncbi:MAG: hypothetical protein ACRDOU_33885 [Streptosporangiaceae bacterium]